MEVVELDQGKATVCREILEKLPQWFAIAESREHYIEEAKKLTMFACLSEGVEIGMLTLKVHSPCNAEIAVMGVLPRFHRRGAGRLLV